MCGIKGSTRLTQEHVKAEAVHKQGVSIDLIPNPHLLRTVVGSRCCKVQPDRVTLQPITATLCRRTPFDHYKNKSAYKNSEVRTSKHLAFQLGISILDLQETLAQEIDDLLKEIEFTRIGAEVFTKDGEERSGHVSQLNQALELSEESRKVAAEPECSPPPFRPRPKCRPKTKCSFVPGKQRGREKVKLTIQSRRNLPPSPPRVRTLDVDDLVGAPLNDYRGYGLPQADQIRSNRLRIGINSNWRSMVLK